jgi:hypothetical protein
MKKTYLYFAAPLAGLALFGVVYYQYSSGYEARQAAMEKKQFDEREAKVKRDNESKKKAVEDALIAQETRKKAKADKEAREQKERDDRDRAVQARGKAKEEARKLVDVVARLKKEVADNKKDITDVEADKKRAVDEMAFVKEYVKKAETNRQSLSLVLEKIEAADRAAEAAAKAAAAAAAAATKK